MRFLEHPTRSLFFTGKGGVGKTCLACASAIRLADRGLRVLLVSTDPASNLDEVLQVHLNGEPTSVETVPNLYGMNIDPGVAAVEYRERMVAPYRGVLPEAAVKSMEEQFSGSCTLEIAAFDEFSRLLGDVDAAREFDHIVFDTAPTGHTLRLLTLPAAWSEFMEHNTTGNTCLGPLAGLQAQQSIYRQTLQSLSDGSSTTLILVTRPEVSALQEATRTSAELKELGIVNQHLAVNGLFEATLENDPVAHAMEKRGKKALAAVPKEIANLQRTTIPLAHTELLGVDALRLLGNSHPGTDSELVELKPATTLPAGLDAVVDEIAAAGRGVILTMGKGGVGKTTIAAAVAVALAERGFPVNLSTTDPAAHLESTLGVDGLPGLRVNRIDPMKEIAEYTEEVMQSAGSGLDNAGKALLEEDLRSPCTEEVAVFRAFAQTVAESAEQFVVLDTAPTGHTILLLDAALSYHREVARQTAQMPETVQNLLPRLRDPEWTRVLIVSLPEATPVHEAARLQQDLRRADIEPFAWVLNQSLSPRKVQDPVLVQRQKKEAPFIDEVQSSLACRTAVVPWQDEPPIGLAGLRLLVRPATWHVAHSTNAFVVTQGASHDKD